MKENSLEVFMVKKYGNQEFEKNTHWSDLEVQINGLFKDIHYFFLRISLTEWLINSPHRELIFNCMKWDKSAKLYT